jgi:hypothetical protein
MEYAPARQRAARELGATRSHREWPSYEAVEDEVRAQLALFHTDTQPGELAALRKIAMRWLERLEEFRPHVSGAVWRGTATGRSTLRIDLYADDPKAPEFALINRNLDYVVGSEASMRRGGPITLLGLVERCADLPLPVNILLTVHDHDDLRGALRPDARGRSWRGDARALRRLLAEESSA